MRANDSVGKKIDFLYILKPRAEDGGNEEKKERKKEKWYHKKGVRLYRP